MQKIRENEYKMDETYRKELSQEALKKMENGKPEQKVSNFILLGKGLR